MRTRAARRCWITRSREIARAGDGRGRRAAGAAAEIGAYRVLKDCWARAAWAWCIWRSAKTWAVWRRSRFCAMRGCRRRGASGLRVERRTLAQLNHPSIARLYDADTLAGWDSVVRHGVRGGRSAHAYCRAHGCDVREKLRLFRAVCEAVHYAHRHAIIHRDLKPSNILVKADGSVRLLDFGIAKQLDSAGDPCVEHTRTGLRMMTPAYAAPEQIRGETCERPDRCLFAGRDSYRAADGARAVRSGGQFDRGAGAHDSGARARKAVGRRRKAQTEPAAWADLDVLCLTAMHKDAARRYRSVEALIRDLDHYLEGEPLEARPDTLGYRTGKFVRRNRRAVIAAAAVLGVGGGPGDRLYGPVGESRAMRRWRRRRERSGSSASC